jgi:hypothetical protein
VGVASLRFALRGHGESEGRQEELTLASILNEIDGMYTVSTLDRFKTDLEAAARFKELI